jgi:intein/homing endonuclease
MTQEIADVYEVELADGRTVKATAEHPFLTRRGWVMLKDLKPTDEIACIGV